MGKSEWLSEKVDFERKKIPTQATLGVEAKGESPRRW